MPSTLPPTSLPPSSISVAPAARPSKNAGYQNLPQRQPVDKTTISQTPSNELAIRWRRGDHGAAAELYSRYFDQVSQLVRGRLNKKFQGRLSSDDVVQSVFKSAFRITRDDPQQFQSDDSFRRWLVTVALNKVFKRIQHESAQKRNPDREQATEASEGFTAYVASRLSQAPRQIEVTEIAELWERVADAVAPEQRDLMRMRLEGMSQIEIADHFGVNPRTVRRWGRDLEQRALEVLQEELASMS